MNKCIVRNAKDVDYEAVEKIMEQVQELHVQWRPDIYKPCAPVLSYETYCQIVSEEQALVAEVDGKVVALLIYQHRHIESPAHVTRDVLFIDSMAVDEAFRGQGIGHQLFDDIKRLAADKHFDGVELQVNARNRAAYEMYRKYGFTEKSINMELL